MKVYFGSHFDSGYYLDYSASENKALFNLKITGPQGLLGLLEQKTGNTGKFNSHAERKIEYMGYLKEYKSGHANVFYSNAFETDPAGISSELLRYRDQLVLASWNKEAKNISERLDTLQDIENLYTVSPGFEDRWVNMLVVLEKMSSNPGIDELFLFDDVADLHPFYRKILGQLSRLGVKIGNGDVYDGKFAGNNLGKLQQLLLQGGEDRNDKITLDGNDRKSIQIFTFQTDVEAAHFFAAQDLSGHDCLVICDNSLVFDSVSSTMERVRPGGGKNLVNTTTLQLFKLSSCLFAQPFNVLNYMAYLQCPLHPVSPALRSKIMKHVSGTGGVDKVKVVEIIDAHDFYPHKDEGPEKEANNQKKQKEVKSLLLPESADRNALDVSQILKFFHALESWAVKKSQINTYGDKLDDSEKKQLMHVYKMAGLFGDAIRQNDNEHVTTDQFMQAIRDVYEPIVVTMGYAEKGAPAMVSSPGQIISRPDVTVWLDFGNQDINSGWYDFLNEDEFSTLEKFGLSAWRKADQAKAMLNTFKKIISRTRSQLCLAIPVKVGDKSASDHPLYSFLKSVVANLDEIVMPVLFPFVIDEQFGWEPIETETKDRILLPEKKITHQINQGHLILKRKKESYSSLELLIQYPFDWVMQYGMQIKSGNSYEMAEVETTLGNVAHAFIQDLFESESYDLARIKWRLDNEYDVLMEKAIIQYGAILLLDENRFEMQRLTCKLKESLHSLMYIITQNRLTIIKSEAVFTQSLPHVEALREQEFYGSLDLLLQDDRGKYIIFDLKWTRRYDKYIKKMRDGKAMQLALYKELLTESKHSNGESVDGVKSGYYLLSHALMITCDDFSGNMICHVEPGINHESMINRISNSIKYRRNQFAEGIIEEGEDEPKENIPYYNETEDGQLVPMDLDSGNKKRKKNYYSKFKVFKGEKK